MTVGPYISIGCLLPLVVAASSVVAQPNMDMWRAIEHNDVASARRLIEGRIPLDSEIADGDTALMRAAFRGRKEIVRVLLERGANPNAKNRLGKTPLMAACEGASEDLVALMLQAGADPNSRGYNGETAYLYAARYTTPSVLTRLERSGADPKAKDDLGRGALLWASFQSNERVVLYLLSKGADPNEIGKDRLTPLLVARTDSARKILLDAGADASVRDLDGGSVLTRAITGPGARDFDLLSRLVARGADVNARDASGNTALMYAAWYGGGDERAVRLFLSHGARVNDVDKYGRTALMRTTKREIADALLKAGAELGIRDQSGRTALGMALWQHQTEIAEFLRQRGAKE